jgi:spoIIIJ-associated protein
MEWVETTGKTLEEAREAALDQLGVGADEAEFDVVEEPKAGLFGRTRGQARLRARIKPTPARPKQERKRRSKSDKAGSDKAGSDKPKASRAKGDSSPQQDDPAEDDSSDAKVETSASRERSTRGRGGQGGGGSRGGGRNGTNNNNQEKKMSNEERPQSDVTPQEVGDAAVSFMNDLVTAFGADGESELTVDGIELDVQVRGDDLGLLVGPGGRTLNAVQDLVRVAAQRRLGDHETRLRIDVAGYRERRSIALGKFAADVAAQVRESGSARSLEPMTSADRKVIHDALNDEDGVTSSSSGEDPYRRVIVEPA